MGKPFYDIIRIGLGVFILIIWKKQVEKVRKEQKLIIKIIKENPHLSEEELIEKIKAELLMRNPRLSRMSSQKEILLKKVIKRRLEESKKIKGNKVILD